MMRGSRSNVLSGQAAIEFTAVLSVVLALAFGTAFIAYAGYQRAQLRHAMTTLADELPAGWESMDPKELARGLLLEDSGLVPADLTVLDAEVATSRDVDVDHGGVTARPELVVRTEQRRVTVSAEVEYTYEDAFALGNEVTTTATAERTYITYTDYRVS